MPSITLTIATTQQATKIADAFESVLGPAPSGTTKARFVEVCLIEYAKDILRAAKRKADEAAKPVGDGTEGVDLS